MISPNKGCGGNVRAPRVIARIQTETIPQRWAKNLYNTQPLTYLDVQRTEDWRTKYDYRASIWAMHKIITNNTRENKTF